MDRGLIILMGAAFLTAAAIILKTIGILSSSSVNTMIAVSLIYHICYTFYSIVIWRGRTRIRNKKRGNLRPPRSNRNNPWN